MRCSCLNGLASSLAAATALASLLLSACATEKMPQPSARYQPPIGGPTSRLLARADLAAGETYGVFITDDNERCLDAHIAGKGDTKSNPPAMTLPAGQLRTLDFVVLKSNRQLCIVRWSFTPTEGKTYLVRGQSAGLNCSARLLDASDPDDIRVEAGALIRSSGARNCTPLAQSTKVRESTAGTPGNSSDAVLLRGAGADPLKGLINP